MPTLHPYVSDKVYAKLAREAESRGLTVNIVAQQYLYDRLGYSKGGDSDA